MTDQGLESSIGPVLGGPRRSRERARIVAVGVVAVVVLAAGIGLVGNGATGLTPSTASTSASLGPSEPIAATSESPSTAGATRTAASCTLVRPGHLPEIRIGSGGALLVGSEGLPRAAASPGPPDGAGAWPAPPIGTAFHLAGSGGILLLLADLDACVQFVSAEYQPADPSLTGPFPIRFRTMEVSPPRSIVPLGPLPDGDWIVRVTAAFLEFAPTASPTPPESTERFFRVIVGPGTRPSDAPTEVAPTVPCGPWDGASQPPDLFLTGTQDGSVPGIPPGTGPPPVTYGSMGSAIEIRTTGDACALSWSISAMNIDTNRSATFDAQDNAAYDPFLAAQNRWLLHNVPTGLLEMTATVHYSADVAVSRRWALIVEPLDFPAVVFRGPDGSTVDGAPGCGAQWTLSAGTGGEVSCTGSPILADVQELAAAPGSVIRVDVPGWTVGTWASACGKLDWTVSQSQPFVAIDSCDLGGGIGPTGIAFIARGSAPVVRLDLSLHRTENDTYEQVDGSVYVSIVPAP
jgi:hypothetical protein